jgi:hypothetical protein
MSRRLMLVILLCAISVVGCSAAATGQPPDAATGQSPDATFPSEIDGLPVISVADTAGLLGSGKLDGRAAAVAGYGNEMPVPCPYPGRYVGPLESWCHFTAVTDTLSSARLCEPNGGNGTRCGMPSATYLSPFFMPETSGDVQAWQTGQEPVALVLIGHAGDPRQWPCTAATQDECANAFVVDRIAWAQGREVPVAVPQTGDQQTGQAITPRMTLAQVAAAIGPDDELLTGAPFRKGDIATIDPRWNFTGDEVIWLVRSLGSKAGSGATQTRPETVWLVDDANGRVIDRMPLTVDARYQPARLWQMATAHGVDCCASDLAAFYRVTSTNGTTMYEGQVKGGMSGGQGSTTFGGGYMSGPLLLPAGDYSVTTWLATYDQGVAGAPRGTCSTEVTLRPLDDVALNADFPPNRSCTFQPAPSQSPGE